MGSSAESPSKASTAASLAKCIGTLVILGVVMIKTRQKKATKARNHRIFGKVVIAQAVQRSQEKSKRSEKS